MAKASERARAGARAGLLALLLIGIAGAGAALIQLELADTLREIRSVRTLLDVRHALGQVLSGVPVETRAAGTLTVVRETESAKYPFLNKRSYLVHTSSSARAETALRGTDVFDKARADRHRRARHLRAPIVEHTPEGEIRATLAEGRISAELAERPEPLAPPSVHLRVLASLAAALLVLFLFRAGFGALPAALSAGLVLGLGLFWCADHALRAASELATAYVWAGGRTGPQVTLPIWPLFAPLGGLVLAGLGLLGFAASPLAARAARSLRRDAGAYAAIGPAMLGLAALVGIPFVFGVSLSLFEHVHGHFRYVGLANFVDILRPGDSFFEPRSLPYSLCMTVFWTALNVSLHLTIGLGLALALHRIGRGVSKVYRLILIVPWAVPSYLTALIWKSMFDPDVGAVNRILGLEGMSWMHETHTAFLANLATNVWLGVPFMMVVCLGALTSIPGELYEAAEVDGASRFAQFWRITLPLLQPALLPAVILGSIWTFNKFDVIYLVSEGRPDGATDILVTEAYRWAFERGLAQGGAYGYAAAYSVVIFLVLIVYGWMTSRVARAAEEALR